MNSIITTMTKPDKRGYAWKEAINSYLEMAEEVIIVCGYLGDMELLDKHFPNNKQIVALYQTWPDEFTWDNIRANKQLGLDNANGEWILSMDLDTIFHEKDLGNIRKALEDVPEDCDVVQFLKNQVIRVDRYYIKSKIDVAIRKNRGVVFGWDKGATYTRPICHGKKGFIPYAVWNYDHTFRTMEQAKVEIERFGRAFTRSWKGKDVPIKSYGEEGQYWQTFINGEISRGNRSNKIMIGVSEHPKYMQDKIRKIKPEQLGYNLWNLV